MLAIQQNTDLICFLISGILVVTTVGHVLESGVHAQDQAAIRLANDEIVILKTKKLEMLLSLLRLDISVIPITI